MCNSLPIVSVCVTTFNRKEKLFNTVKSILNQSFENFEIIIVDDCSLDCTQSFVEEKVLKLDTRIKYFRHDVNRGLSVARNTAIKKARGRYFTFCDDDDLWSDNFLDIFIKNSKKYDDSCSFCASLVSNDIKVKSIHSSYKNFILQGYTPPVASQFYPIGILKEISGYNENIKSGVDHDLWLTLALYGYKLVWLNLELVTVNQDNTQDRMTLNFNKRVNGIKKSIEIWRNRIGNNFGKNFFYFFEKNYEYNTYKKHILSSLKRKDCSNIFSNLIKLPKSILILDMIRYFKRIFKNEEILIHPTFTKCFSESELFVESKKIKIKYED